MEIQLNNQPKKISPHSSVQQLLDEVVGEKQKGIAIAINNTVIPKSAWTQHLIQSNDNILIIKATQGG
ncbi:sulfur carrier protein ThiS [Chitinophagaceae bacterium LB-8]|uniref:Sulfur carrier protein ThiS n=1 Tax=Paraflavisolibacter caeni TaxID=2982496 RepID=A0A9X2XTK5_9BACT|nr:sulfur carrier protein ThiS [Paraflavisolibacter caeni]MCU7548116.1 sulfur carrier protein ThiS [Paraflavisolibacter caeni]